MSDPFHLVTQYHEAMPIRIREYLNHRGIVDAVIDVHLLGWNGERITIPIFDHEGRFACFKLSRDPEVRTGPKMLTSAGGKAELYGWERLRVKPPRIVVCEGEFDRLVLESHGIAAITSTGGAGVFKTEWARALQEVPEVFICFDNDEAGRNGAGRVADMVPHARIVQLPEEVGLSGDVTDYFVKLGGTIDEFEQLMEAAVRPPMRSTAIRAENEKYGTAVYAKEGLSQEIARLKAQVRLEKIVGAGTVLRSIGKTLVGLCPFHDDHTPSFVIYPLAQTFHCFGCPAHGDVIDYIRRTEKLTFAEALSRLDEIARLR
ncbi:MAG TPA: CHC2 zinc finger domain-containing protein [Candidatus Polarisedimenticolia bacterium]|nr:CHC2 zinc finger domain-containing protein [Candidatus Polarisedimenticolia bacterium]